MIAFEGVSRHYGDTTVVEDVSFTVARGEIAAVVGTSGAGKSTLLRMVNRLVEPTAGRIRVDGADVSEVPAFELRRRIGYVIQGNGLFPHRTVAQNIATVPQLLGWRRQRIDARVEELLTLFELPPAAFAARYPHELSGGEQQRVGVARALAAGSGVLLMDEPFGALDPIIRAKAQADLVAIQRRLGTTVLVVTHDMDEAIRLGDRIAVMSRGRLLQYASPADILARPVDAFVGAFVGEGDRPFRLLSLTPVANVVEPGPAAGPAIASSASLRDALADLLWTGREAAPVAGADGAPIGRVTRERLVACSARPT